MKQVFEWIGLSVLLLIGFWALKPDSPNSGPSMTPTLTQAPVSASPEPSQEQAATQVAAEEPKAVETQTPAVQSLTAEDLRKIQEMSAKSERPDFVPNQKWYEQVDYMFTLAERSHDVEVYDFLRKQIVLARFNDSKSSRVHALTWYDRYMKLETRADMRDQLSQMFTNTIPGQ